MKGSAHIRGPYRYYLTRSWGAGRGGWVVWVMLNPSTANHRKNDPTIRRCISFTDDWGFRRFIVVNLYALRSPEPRNLWMAKDPVGPGNNAYIEWAVNRALETDGLVIGAWGGRARQDRIAEVLGIPGMSGISCLGVTNSGQPRHPLFLPGDTPLRDWHAAAA